jgi:antitoxin CptB
MENRLKRLRYRSWHRGCKETDIILGNFSDQKLETLTPALLDVYERLLDEDDANIWDWISGKSSPSHEEYTPLITMFRSYGLPAE